MNKVNFLLFFIFSFIFISCHNSGPNPQDLVGKYDVSFKLKDDFIDKSSIQDSIENAFNQVGLEMDKAKLELDEELDLRSIDTTQLEGKIEFAAKSLSKSVAEIGLNLGGLGKDLSGLLSGLASSSLDLSESILKNLKFEIELQADGDIKGNNSSLVTMSLNNSKWKVDGDDFMIIGQNETENQKLTIIERSSDGFTLEKEKVLIYLKKK